MITSTILTVSKFISALLQENYCFKLVRGFEIQITRGLGQRQKEDQIITNYRIIKALYTKPYTYQQLWRVTKIHRNTLKLRLDKLVNDRIILKRHYTFNNYRGKYVSPDFYLLDWAKKQSREILVCFKTPF